MQKEAAVLRSLFAGVNRARFAGEHGIKGGGAMVYQHISARRPISIEAGIAYAKAFGVTLATISPYLASLVQPAPPQQVSPTNTATDPVLSALAYLDSVSPAKANLFRAQIMAAEEDARRERHEHHRVSDPPPIVKKA